MYYENKNKTLVSCIFKIIILMTGGIGECLFFFENTLDSFSQFTYYIHQINILSLLIVFILLCLNIRDLKRIVNKEVVPFRKGFCSILHYFMSATIAAPCLLSVVLMFFEDTSQKLNLNFGNILSHFLFPVMILADWFVFGRIHIKRMKGIYLYAAIIPLIYALYIILAESFLSLPVFEGKLEFLDYNKNGWFRIVIADRQIGVFYYLIIMFAVIILINYIILKINVHCHKKENRKRLI